MSIITDDLKNLFNSAIDSLLEDGALTTPCRITYSPYKNTACPNCRLDPITRQSAGIYNGTGPSPFTNGTICPVCGGVYFIYVESTEIVYLGVMFNEDRNKFLRTLNLSFDVGEAITLCASTLYPKLQRAKDIVFDINIEGYSSKKFQRLGEPVTLGFGSNRYILINWKRLA